MESSDTEPSQSNQTQKETGRISMGTFVRNCTWGSILDAAFPLFYLLIFFFPPVWLG